MTLAKVIADVVKVVDKFTEDEELQTRITLHRFAGQSGSGATSYHPKVLKLRAVVELKQMPQAPVDSIKTKAYVAILEPIPPLKIAGVDRVNPVDTRDKVTLPDGTTGPIVAVQGPVSGLTGEPYITELWIGE